MPLAACSENQLCVCVCVCGGGGGGGWVGEIEQDCLSRVQCVYSPVQRPFHFMWEREMPI